MAALLRLWLLKRCQANLLHRWSSRFRTIGERDDEKKKAWARVSASLRSPARSLLLCHKEPRYTNVHGASNVCLFVWTWNSMQKRYIAHWTDRHKCRQPKLAKKKMRIDKSKKRTKITCNDRTDAPDVYNYLCIAEREHIHSVVHSSAFLFRLFASSSFFLFSFYFARSPPAQYSVRSQQFYSLRWFVCNLSPMSARKKKHTRTAQCSAQIAHLKNETREMIAEISVFSAEWTRNYIQATFI